MFGSRVDSIQVLKDACTIGEDRGSGDPKWLFLL